MDSQLVEATRTEQSEFDQNSKNLNLIGFPFFKKYIRNVKKIENKLTFLLCFAYKLISGYLSLQYTMNLTTVDSEGNLVVVFLFIT